ncbi:hypothetical protein [Mycoplasma wenyonii]|nr:hypothetical protein [Mycoplasma wenyonii]
MSWVARGMTLLVASSGVSFSPQGVKEVTNWAKNLKIFNAPPALL